MASQASCALRYGEPAPPAVCPARLVLDEGSPAEREFGFIDRIEVGRTRPEGHEPPGLLALADQTVSRCHCIVTRRPDGRCFLRDTSRNGTWLDGRRLVPNVDVELRPGQRIGIGAAAEFVLRAEAQIPCPGLAEGAGTMAVPQRATATVLVGDIKDYTVLVRSGASVDLQRSVCDVFSRLSDVVAAHGGTVKEYQGDALVAFWEGNLLGAGAVGACRAALATHETARRLADDRSVWRVSGVALEMHWALASGPVVIDSFGAGQPAGLAMIGEPLVLASRLEKFATAETGPILACRRTREMACHEFAFRSLGPMLAKGFDQPDHVFALDGPRRDGRA